MPDSRHHRGKHPEDEKLFSPENWPALRAAVADLSWLLSRGYGQTSAVKVVGDRYRLDARQRTAVVRCACTDEQAVTRAAKRLRLEQIGAAPVLIDGYNLLTTIEVALGGGVVLGARDGCFRDVASIHGTYRKVEETVPAIRLARETLARAGAPRCLWYLDAPVSNSGRLKGLILEAAAGADWTVEVVPNPDAVLIASRDGVVATADSVVLDGCTRWVGLARHVVETGVPDAWIVDLGRADVTAPTAPTSPPPSPR